MKDKTQKERFIMMKEFLIRSGIMITGILVTNAVIEKLEKRALNRKPDRESEEEVKEPTEKPKLIIAE
jgi:hypothetical protein